MGKNCHTCPFSFNEESETVQNYGCLPSPYDIITMRVKHNKTWACHSDTNKPCVGAIKHLQDNNLPSKVLDKKLITESDAWHLLN